MSTAKRGSIIIQEHVVPFARHSVIDRVHLDEAEAPFLAWSTVTITSLFSSRWWNFDFRRDDRRSVLTKEKVY